MRIGTYTWKFAGVLVALLAMSVGCSEAETEVASEQTVEMEPYHGDYSDPVDPVMIVDVENHQAARALFADGTAHFESSDTFRQVSWMMDAEGAEGLQFRALQQDGWTQWEDVEITFHEDIFYNALIRLDEPATELEMRGGEQILSAQLEFFEEIQARDISVDVEAPALDGPVEQGSGDDISTLTQASVAPSSLVVSRSQWGASQPNKICGSVVAPYRMAIHHTYMPSSDGGDPAARMRSMQSYHKNNRGWCDIGYHFVVSQSGNIYQGRSRSNRPAAHVGGNNSGNVGISFIADFGVQNPTNTQLNAGADIMRWVHDTHGVPLTRSKVLGHREHSGQSTSCPGDNMIPLINELLNRANSGGATPEPEPAPPTPGSCGGVEDSDAQGIFADFPQGNVGYDEAVMLYNAGITNGCQESPLMFCPRCEVNRQQMAAFLARAADLDTSNPPATPTFSDVPTTHTFYAEIEAIAAADITRGCGNDKFCPGDQLTRAQAATMIYRARGWSDETPASGPSFGDVPASHTHYEAIETINQRCVTNGCGDGSDFCPDRTVVRGHVAAFIARAFNLEGNNPCAADPAPAATEPTTDPDPQPDPDPKPATDPQPDPEVTGPASSDANDPNTSAQIQSTGSGCSSTSSAPSDSPLMVFALFAFGLVALRRKRL